MIIVDDKVANPNRYLAEKNYIEKAAIIEPIKAPVPEANINKVWRSLNPFSSSTLDSIIRIDLVMTSRNDYAIFIVSKKPVLILASLDNPSEIKR